MKLFLVLLSTLLIFLIPHVHSVGVCSSSFSVSYEVKSFSSVGLSGAWPHLSLSIARLHVKWPSNINHKQIETTSLSVTCPPSSSLDVSLIFHSFGVFPHLLVDSRTPPALAHAINTFINITQTLTFASSNQQNDDHSTTAYVLLHEFPNSTFPSSSSPSCSPPSSTLSRRRAPLIPNLWSRPIHPCETSSPLTSLACCQVTARVASSTPSSSVPPSTLTALAQPFNSRRVNTKQIFQQLLFNPSISQTPTTSPPSSSPSPSSLVSSLLSVRDVFGVVIRSSGVARPSHPLPAHWSRRHYLAKQHLNAVKKKAQLMTSFSKSSSSSDSSSDSSSPSSSVGDVSPSLTSFIESSGWSMGAFHASLDMAADPHMSQRSKVMLGMTHREQEEVSELMTDITTAFFQTTEQVANYFAAGVGSRQLIALIVDKMVLRCIPPKMGLGIVKALQQPMLNMFKEVMSDSLTKFLVPPGSAGSFIQQRAAWRPLDKHQTIHNTINILQQVNPAVAAVVQERQMEFVERHAQQLEQNKLQQQSAQETVFLDVSSSISSNVSSSSPRVDVDAHPILTESTSSTHSSVGSTTFLRSAAASLSSHGVRTHSHVYASGDAIGDKVKQYLGPRLVNGVVQDTAIQLLNVMHWQLREKLSNVIYMTVHRALGRSLTESLTPSVTDAVSEVLKAALRLQITREATHVLSRTLTLTLTPALTIVLSRSLTRTPQADY